MEMGSIDFYTEAHLVVSAIRMLEYRHTRPPSVGEVCDMLAFSLEKGNRLCRKLSELEAIRLIEGAYGVRLSVQDHLKLEEIPRGKPESRLSNEVKRFQDQRNHFTHKVESIQAEQADKKKSLFAELEKQLKSDLGEKEPSE